MNRQDFGLLARQNGDPWSPRLLENSSGKKLEAGMSRLTGWQDIFIGCPNARRSSLLAAERVQIGDGDLRRGEGDKVLRIDKIAAVVGPALE